MCKFFVSYLQVVIALSVWLSDFWSYDYHRGRQALMNDGENLERKKRHVRQTDEEVLLGSH